MLPNELRQSPQPTYEPTITRTGDLSAMLRVMKPLDIQSPDPVSGRRQLVADLCRIIGVKVGAVDPASLGLPPQLAPGHSDTSEPKNRRADNHLAPRLDQTLRLLLEGYSEKQVAGKLGLSRHTVHDYVKMLYRHFEVASRAELMAKQLGK